MTRPPSEKPDPRLSRRRFLQTGLAAAGVTALAGCGYRPGGGDVRWEAGGGGLHGPDDLLAADGTAFAVARSEYGYDWEAEEWGDYSRVTAYDSADGTALWEHEGTPVGRPAADDRTLYLGDEAGTLTALAADGSERWQQSVGGFPRTLAAAGGRVYALTESGDIVAFAAEDGEQAWSETVGADGRTALAATGNGVVVRRAPDDATAFAARYRDGERRWEAQLPASTGRWDGRPVVAHGTAYVFGGRELTALALDDGTKRWSRRTTYPRGRVAAGDGSLFFVSDETLYALGTGDGSTRWRFEPRRREGYGLASSPAVADGGVYVGGEDAVVAVSADDGSVRWRARSERVSTRPRVVGETVVVVTNGGSVRGHWRQ